MARDEAGDGGVRRSVRSRAGVEENTLAILDAFESSDSRYSHDDRTCSAPETSGLSFCWIDYSTGTLLENRRSFLFRLRVRDSVLMTVTVRALGI